MFAVRDADEVSVDGDVLDGETVVGPATSVFTVRVVSWGSAAVNDRHERSESASMNRRMVKDLDPCASLRLSYSITYSRVPKLARGDQVTHDSGYLPIYSRKRGF